ncbi:SpoVR family protein [Pseudemcibacter aquimaris]|uniref:SpoVR family protein n=1 Tax=Pseudemcibacter aquimaris TaxID=2857064 RepID=UPI002012939E|nr:SpoVR family protein [Pseudemcibacter aquimaris]MCC3861540.1 SpoVR family protein [Pseudemcibacter aquimaris]WDU58309.1 SpoVR family protein [Pseudemcibacter aquimaris]
MADVSKKEIGKELLYSQAEWDFLTIERTFKAIEDIALNEMGLDVYPTQVEVITSEQMLDAYSSIGMPMMYNHWSFGKSFLRDEIMYKKGFSGLAYEIVINSDPCICYIMEENSMTMQALVMSHAAFGHNHFFKNNHLFKQWTDADAILDYLQYAKNYVAKCEEKHGVEAVEKILDSAHALRDQSVDKYTRPQKLDNSEIQKREIQRLEYEQSQYRQLWRTLPEIEKEKTDDQAEYERILSQKLGLPESNLIYFLEKHSPVLERWQSEILRIVRSIAQYFYPQKQTKMMNEGCACFTHYHIMNRLYDTGQITEGSMLEFIDFHTRVVAQPEFDSPYYGGLNPYALGFAMMKDIERICENPTDEDREWFPDFAGSNKTVETLKDAWENFRDESFILQFLSPKLVRDFRFFNIYDNMKKRDLEIKNIHNQAGYKAIRSALAAQHSVANMDLDIQVTNVDLKGDRTLTLLHWMNNEIELDDKEAKRVISHIRRLWGYKIELNSINPLTNEVVMSIDG